jgi:hypothetical protein
LAVAINDNGDVVGTAYDPFAFGTFSRLLKK